MKNFSDGGDASDETRAGARDVAIGVERVDLAIADGGDGMPLGRKVSERNSSRACSLV